MIIYDWSISTSKTTSPLDCNNPHCNLVYLLFMHQVMQGFLEHQLCRAEEIENHKFYPSYSFTYGFVFILKHSSPLIRHLATFSLECCMQRGERKAQTVQLAPCDVESTWRGLITRVFPYNRPAGRKCWLHPKLYTQHKDFRAQRGQALAPHDSWMKIVCCLIVI